MRRLNYKIICNLGYPCILYNSLQMSLDICREVVPWRPEIPKCAGARLPSYLWAPRVWRRRANVPSLSRNHLDLYLLSWGFICKAESSGEWFMLCVSLPVCFCYSQQAQQNSRSIALLPVPAGQAPWSWLLFFDLRNSNGYSLKASNILVTPNASELLAVAKNSLGVTLYPYIPPKARLESFTSLGISKK